MEHADCVDETPADFLTKLGKMLLKQKGTDTDLADIITKHLLTVTPSDTCVVDARADIIALSAKRAATMEAGGGNNG